MFSPGLRVLRLISTLSTTHQQLLQVVVVLAHHYAIDNQGPIESSTQLPIVSMLAYLPSPAPHCLFPAKAPAKLAFAGGSFQAPPRPESLPWHVLAPGGRVDKRSSGNPAALTLRAPIETSPFRPVPSLIRSSTTAACATVGCILQAEVPKP